MNNPNPLLSKAHLTTFNLNNFKMVEAMGLKMMYRDPLEWNHFPIKHHQAVQKLLVGDTKTDRLVI
jgi:hypothetical protein